MPMVATAWGGELQSPPPNNVSQGFQMPAGCAQGISLSKQYGMKPTILAAYGPPYQQILTLATTTAAPAGSTSLQVSFVSGVGGDTLSTIAYPYDYVAASNMSGFLSPAHSYAGTLISGINLSSATRATLSLASATQVAVPAGTTLTHQQSPIPFCRDKQRQRSVNPGVRRLCSISRQSVRLRRDLLRDRDLE